MQSRRDFLRQAALLLAGGMVAPRILSSCADGSSKYLGLQLYSLRDMVNEKGIQAALEAAAQMGYNNLENAGYDNGLIYGLEPADFRQRVEALGMRATSCHIGNTRPYVMHEKNLEWWKQAIDAHGQVGMKYIIMPWSPLGKEGITLDDVKEFADYFNEVGKLVSAAGMQFGYHNHHFEFQNKFEDKPIHEWLIEYTDPASVLFELDVYWIAKGGYDPVEYMKKHADRIQVLHIKDETAIGVQNTVDFKAVFDQAVASGKVKDWYVEVERYDGTPEEDVKKSADYLLNASFVKSL